MLISRCSELKRTYKVVLEKYRRKDCADIEHLLHDYAMPGDYMLSGENVETYVARSGGELVGFFTLNPYPHLYHFCTRPNFGGRVVALLTGVLTSRGVNKFEIRCPASHKRLQHYIERKFHIVWSGYQFMRSHDSGEVVLLKVYGSKLCRH